MPNSTRICDLVASLWTPSGCPTAIESAILRPFCRRLLDAPGGARPGRDRKSGDLIPNCNKNQMVSDSGPGTPVLDPPGGAGPGRARKSGDLIPNCNKNQMVSDRGPGTPVLDPRRGQTWPGSEKR